MSESEENQSSSPPVASDEALLPSDEFSTISKVEEENISGEIEIDVGKGLLDEVSKEVAGKINYDGLLISASLLDKGDYKPIEDEEFDFDIPEEHFNISLTGVTQTSIESDSFDLDTFLGIRKLHTAASSTQSNSTQQPPETEAGAATQEEPDQVQESVLLPSAVEGSQEVTADKDGEDDNVIISGSSCIGDNVVALDSNQQLDNEDSQQENNNDNNIITDPPPAASPQTSEQTDNDKLTSNDISPIIIQDKAPPMIADTPLDGKKFPADDETPYSDYVTPPTRIHEISSETSGAVTADSADFSSSSYSSTCLMTADTKLSPIKAPLQGEGVESDTKKDAPSIRTSSLRKPSAKKGAFSSSPFDSEGSVSTGSTTFVKDSTFTVSKTSGSDNDPVSLSNETQTLETAEEGERTQDNKKTQNETFCSSISSKKNEGTTGSTKISKSRLVKPSTSTTATTTAGKSKLVRPSSARTASSTAATGLNKKPIKPTLMATKGKTLATTTRPAATKQQPMAARGGSATSTGGLKSKSAPSITGKGSGVAPANKPLIKGPSSKSSVTKGSDKTDGAGVGVGVKKGSVRSGLVPPSSRPSSAKTGSQVAPPTKGKSLLTKPVPRKPVLGVATKKPDEIKRKKKVESTKDVGVTETDSNVASDVATPTTRRHSTGDTPVIKSDATPNRLKRRSFIPTPTRITDKEARPISCQFDDHIVKRAAQSRFKRPAALPKGMAKTNGTKPVETAKPPEDPVQSEEVEFEYDPEYEKQLLSLTSKPKVFHSPLNKENLKDEPHSEWSPVPRRMTYLPGDESIQCTKYTHVRNNS